MATITDRIPFRLSNNTPGIAKILIVELPDRRNLVICAEEDEDDDGAAPVNMAIEYLFRTVCGRHKLNPAEVVFGRNRDDPQSDHPGRRRPTRSPSRVGSPQLHVRLHERLSL